ncbi:hypothetical protein KEM56_007169 [Ascosphaera pollenicola]|nr:hypothetical protein KEM56_007169 [Ascosphaera pollenicola]
MAANNSSSMNPQPAPEAKIYGTTCLPASRVKAIVKADAEIAKLSNPATFSLSIATQLFVEYLTQQAFYAMRSDGRKGTLQYRDVAAAVSRIDNLEFLSDVIPKTTTYRSYKQKRARETAKEASHTNNSNSTETTMGSEEVASGDGHLPTQTKLDTAAGHHFLPGGQQTVREYMMMAAMQPPAQTASRLRPRPIKRPSLDTTDATPSVDTATPPQPPPAKRQSRSMSQSMSPVDLKNLINERDLSPVPSSPELSRAGSRRGSLKTDDKKAEETIEKEEEKDDGGDEDGDGDVEMK